MRYDAWIRYSLGKEVLLAFTLTLAVVFDYLTGSVAALRTGAWSSRAACDGLWRKAGIMAGAASCSHGLCLARADDWRASFEYCL